MRFMRESYFVFDDTVELEYDTLDLGDVVVSEPTYSYNPNMVEPPEPDTVHVVLHDYEYEVDKEDVALLMIEYLIDWDDYPEVDFENEAEVDAFVEDNFDELMEKYEQKILDNYEDDAIEYAIEHYEEEHDYERDEDY